MYNDALWAVTMSLSCVGVGEIVSVHGYYCRRLMSSFWGSWKNFVLANTAAPNAGGAELASWDGLSRCMWCVFLLICTKNSKFHCERVIWSLSLEVVSHGDFSNVYWRWSPMEIKTLDFRCGGLEMDNLGDVWYSSLPGICQKGWFGEKRNGLEMSQK